MRTMKNCDETFRIRLAPRQRELRSLYLELYGNEEMYHSLV